MPLPLVKSLREFIRESLLDRIAREHLPIVGGLESGSAELAAALLASHSNRRVEFLQNEPRRPHATPALAPAPVTL